MHILLTNRLRLLALTHLLLSLRAVLAAVVVLLSIQPAHAQSFQGLGTLPGDNWSHVLGISADGSVLVGRSTGTVARPVWWRDGLIQPLPGEGLPGPQAVSAEGNSNRTMVGALPFAVPNTPHAVRWDADGTFAPLALLPDASSQGGQAHDISADGSVIVGYGFVTGDSGASQNRAVRWENGVPQNLGTLGGSAFPISIANGVSPDGSTIVGETSSPAGRVAFRWTQASSMEALPCLPSQNSCNASAAAISADGSTIVGYSNDATITNRAVLWRGGEIVSLGTLFSESERSYAYAVSADGRVVTGYIEVPGTAPNAGFIWTEADGMRSVQTVLQSAGLDVDGWQFIFPTYVSDDGMVVAGTGVSPTRAFEGWRAVLGEPSQIVVNSTADRPNPVSSTTCDTGETVIINNEEQPECTLRAAIQAANQRGGERIIFSIPGEGVPSIAISDEQLPRFDTRIILDATTQPGGLVELAGPYDVYLENMEVRMGIWIGPEAGGSQVRGLVIYGFGEAGIYLEPGANECVIAENRIGTDATGTIARGNGDHHLYGSAQRHSAGLVIRSDDNLVEHNIIAGNLLWDTELLPHGHIFGSNVDVLIWGGASDNRIEGNRIGVGADGSIVSMFVADNVFYSSIGIHINGGEFNRIGPSSTTGPPDVCEHPCNWIAGHAVPIYMGYANFEIEDVHFPGNNNIVVRNFIQVDSNGEPLDGLHRSIFIGNPFDTSIIHQSYWIGSNVMGGGIFIANARWPRITGNRIRYRDTAPMGLNGVVAIGLPSPHPIEGIEVVDNEITSSGGYGIFVAGRTTGHISGNLITNHSGGGIAVGRSNADRSRVVISQNTLIGNGIGIDLGADGVTTNDISKMDSGPNDLLNWPVIIQAERREDHSILIDGFLLVPFWGNLTYTLEAFGVNACNRNALDYNFAHGEGETYLGTIEVTSSLLSDGNLPFTFELSPSDDTPHFITLTASIIETPPPLTRGITSEFSRCFPVSGTSRTARADVLPEDEGTLLADHGVTITRGGDAAARTYQGMEQVRGNTKTGTIFLTIHNGEPRHNEFTETGATSVDGTTIVPTIIGTRHWHTADLGLITPVGEFENFESSFVYDVCLNPAGTVPTEALGSVVLVRRYDDTEGIWTPMDTYAEEHGGNTVLCAYGLTAFGEFSFGAEESVFTHTEPDDLAIPTSFTLSAVYPNPTMHRATVEFEMPYESDVRIEVFDMLGRRTGLLVSEHLPAGRHNVQMDAGPLASGVYIVRMQAGSFSATRRVTIVR